MEREVEGTSALYSCLRKHRHISQPTFKTTVLSQLGGDRPFSELAGFAWLGGGAARWHWSLVDDRSYLRGRAHSHASRKENNHLAARTDLRTTPSSHAQSPYSTRRPICRRLGIAQCSIVRHGSDGSSAIGCRTANDPGTTGESRPSCIMELCDKALGQSTPVELKAVMHSTQQTTNDIKKDTAAIRRTPETISSAGSRVQRTTQQSPATWAYTKHQTESNPL